ncbi:nucleoside-diphosphate sugar epimerase [Sanguibacter inulinus]|uniref:Nucleoside-diphosphate sugar epimerase n=1 Tax=Sanguibacter inulinus TaxID=60922 RepID=A0A853EP86_9MICO|nr:nucleoside-diphosphate sugar epimerase [Sanguibacter inulinus]MBF0721206.1 nucleoside-diphosphate sugar epimerase [Sanguibacter inulinus]NYS92351.1 nucleoside-diphosphate sugar epimerase [Sanguibacter inulinus]
MTPHLVRSGRTVVVGESPVARGLREALGVRLHAPGGGGDAGAAISEHPASDDGSAGLDGAEAVVIVGQTGDFESVVARRTAERRAETAERVHAAVAAAVAAGVVHVVGISSAMVEGAAPGRALIDDGDDGDGDGDGDDGDDSDGTDGAGSTAPDPGLEPDEPDEGAAGDLRAFEAALREAAAVHQVPRLTVLRPAVLVGPGVDTLLTRHFEAPRILTVRGTRRDWQLVHVDDLASAVAVCVEHGLTGALTVGAVRDGAPDVLDPDEVVAITGLRTVDLPAAVAFAAAERLHRVGALPAPASDLACTVYPWTVSARRLTAAGWVPGWSSRSCLELLVDQARGRLGVGGRRVARRDAAALGAAGAAVALLGTAAVWRQARGRR